MQSKQTLIEIAYSFLCKKKESNFNEIWTHVKKQCNIPKEDEEKFAGELYTGIILNTNFFLQNNNLWCPRSEVSLEEIKERMIKAEIPNNNKEEEIDNTETFADETTNLNEESEDEEDLDTINIQPLEDSYDDE